MTSLLALRGAPGVGKSSVARLLADLLPASVVEVDDLRGELWRSGLTDAWTDEDRHQVALLHAASTARALLRAGIGHVIVVDTFNDADLASFRQFLDDVPARALALVADPEVLEPRVLRRPGGPEAFRDAAVSLAMNAALLVGAEHLDTTTRPPSEIATAIAARLRSTTPALTV